MVERVTKTGKIPKIKLPKEKIAEI